MEMRRALGGVVLAVIFSVTGCGGGGESSPSTVAAPDRSVGSLLASSESVSQAASGVYRSSLTPGENQWIRDTLTSSTGVQNLQVEIRLVDGAGQQVASRTFSDVAVAAGGSTVLQFDYAVPAALALGRYTSQLTVTDASGQVLIAQQPGAFFDVGPCQPEACVVDPTLSAYPLNPGQLQTIQVTLKPKVQLGNAQAEVRVVNAQGAIVASKNFPSIYMPAGSSSLLQFDYQSPASLPLGTYTVQVGVWTADWTHTYYYDTLVAFSVSAPSGTPAPSTNYSAEAEQGTVTGSGVSVQADATANNGAYVGNFTALGDSVTMTIANVAQGTYDVAVRFRSWGEQQNEVRINGVLLADKKFPGQGNAWMDKVFSGLSLNGGTNTFTITAGWGYMDVDSIRITPSGATSGEFPGWGSDPDMPLRKLLDPDDIEDLLVVGSPGYAYWIEDGVWGRGTSLTRGTFTGTTGTQYETAYARSETVGPNGEVAWRSAWKWPDCPSSPSDDACKEVKAYPSAVFGQKPGWANHASMPGGHVVLNLDGTQWTEPNMDANHTLKTPGSFLPLTVDSTLPTIHSSASFHHLVAPSGRGHVAYDIWLQHTPVQSNGWDSSTIAHEIMIPLTYWGDYGKCDTRHPGWAVTDPATGMAQRVTIDNRQWCLYNVPAAGFNGQWGFIVFEPVEPLAPDTVHTLNISAFIEYARSRGWVASTESLVSIELGVEMQYGVGDTEIKNYRVWK